MTRSHGMEPIFVPRATPIIIQVRDEVKSLFCKQWGGTLGWDGWGTRPFLRCQDKFLPPMLILDRIVNLRSAVVS